MKAIPIAACPYINVWTTCTCACLSMSSRALFLVLLFIFSCSFSVFDLLASSHFFFQSFYLEELGNKEQKLGITEERSCRPSGSVISRLMICFVAVTPEELLYSQSCLQTQCVHLPIQTHMFNSGIYGVEYTAKEQSAACLHVFSQTNNNSAVTRRTFYLFHLTKWQH